MLRREWLRLVGAGAASLAVGCGDDDAPSDVLAAALEPDPDRVLVAVYDPQLAATSVEVRDGIGALVASADLALDEHGAGVADLTGLAPRESYEITVHAGSLAPVATLALRTPPAADDPADVRIAISADYDPHPMWASPIIDSLLATDPDVFVSLGDFPYCDNGPAVAQTAPEYRQRHAYARAAPAMRTLYGSVGVRSIYDDHEFRNDWNPDFVAREGDRYAAATAVWDQFFPLRDARVRYRQFHVGANVECFLLDCRRYRSANAAPDDAQKTMLGAEQLAWLLAGVRASSAAFKLILTSVPLDYGIGVDHWKGYTNERERMFDGLVGIPGVLFISGDQHYFAAYRHAHGIREFQVGPLARGIGPFGDEGSGVLFRAGRFNAGIVEVSASELRVIGLGETGERFYEQAFSPDELRPV